MKRIAVISSVYINDRLTFVQEAFESIFSQTYTNFDFFVQQDGPVDSCVKEYLSLCQIEGKLLTFERKENKGLAHSLNDLLNKIMPMGYEYIVRMDADDISLPERFERQLAYLEAHKDVDCLGTWAIEITNNGEEYFRKQMPITHYECWQLFKKRDCMIHPTVMYRRSYIEKAGLYAEDTYFGEDTMMWAQGFKAGCKLENLPEYLFKFRLDENFFERRRGWKHASGILKLRRRVNKMLGYGLDAKFYALAYAIAKMMPQCILNIIYKTAR